MDNSEDATSLYEQLGREPGIRALVDRFYDHMDSNAQAKVIRELHPKDLSNARERLYMFLVGWSGGPQLYIEKYGHPRLRMKHLPFKIGKQERDLWMQCMLLAMDDVGLENPLRFFLLDALLKVADHMRNQEDR